VNRLPFRKFEGLPTVSPEPYGVKVLFCKPTHLHCVTVTTSQRSILESRFEREATEQWKPLDHTGSRIKCRSIILASLQYSGVASLSPRKPATSKPPHAVQWPPFLAEQGAREPARESARELGSQLPVACVGLRPCVTHFP